MSLKVEMKFNIALEKFLENVHSQKILIALEGRLNALFIINYIQSGSTVVGLSVQSKNETSDPKVLVGEISLAIGSTYFGIELLSSYVGLG